MQIIKKSPGLAMFLLLCAFASAPAMASQCNSLVGIDWLLGDWQGVGERADSSERWIALDDSTWQGVGVTDKPEKAPMVESLHLLQIGNEVFYLAKPPQNDLPVAFKMTYCDHSRVRFENAQHDFPQQIEYRTNEKGGLVANVSSQDNPGFSIHFAAARKRTSSNQVLVQDYVSAYNQKDLAGMMRMVAENVRWLSVDGKQLKAETESKAELAETLRGYFAASSESHSELLSISTAGDFVSVIEQASWRADKSKPWQAQCSPAIYQIKQGLIQAVWYFPSTDCQS